MVDMSLFYKFIKDKNSIVQLPKNTRFEFKGEKENNSIFSEVYNHYSDLIERESGLFYITTNGTNENYGFINNLETEDFSLDGDIKFSQITLEKITKSKTVESEKICEIENLGVRTPLIKYNETKNKYYIPKFYEGINISTYVLNGQPLIDDENSKLNFIEDFIDVSDSDKTGTNANGLKVELLDMNNHLKVGYIDENLGMKYSDTELEVKPGTSKFVFNKNKIEFHIKGSTEINDSKYLNETKSEGNIAFFDVDEYYPIFCESNEKVGFEIENSASLYDGKKIVRIYSNKLVEDENYTEVST